MNTEECKWIVGMFQWLETWTLVGGFWRIKKFEKVWKGPKKVLELVWLRLGEWVLNKFWCVLRGLVGESVVISMRFKQV